MTITLHWWHLPIAVPALFVLACFAYLILILLALKNGWFMR